MNDSRFENGSHSSEEDESLDVRLILFRLIPFWPWFLASVFISFFGAFLLNRYTVPTFHVKGTFLIQKEENAGNILLEELGADLSSNANIQNEIGILNSYTLLKEVVDSLGLTTSYYSIGNIREAQLYESVPFTVHLLGNTLKHKEQGFRILDISETDFSIKTIGNGEAIQYSYGDTITFDGSVFYLSRANHISADRYSIIDVFLREPMSMAKSVRGKLNIKPLNKESTIIEISAQTPVPNLMADFINVLMEKYIERELSDKNETSTRTIKFIDNQLGGIEQELFNAESQLENFRAENKIINISEEGMNAFSQLQSLENELATLKIQKEYFEYLKNYLKNTPESQVVSPSVAGISDQTLDNLIIRFNELSSELILLEASASEVDPRVNTLKIQIRRILDAVKENVELLIDGVEIRIKDLESRITLSERELNLLPSNERKLVNIQRRFSLNENLYIYLLQKKAESSIVKAGNVPTSKVVDRAMVFERMSPKTLKNYSIAAFLGFSVPLGFILLIWYLQNSISSMEEIARRTKVPVLGMLAFSKHNDELILKDYANSIEAESIRAIRSNLRFMSQENGGGKVVMLTSFLSGEGKTFTTLNLASSLALSGRKTLLIGLDLRKKEDYTTLEVQNDVGMTNFLINEKSLGEIIQKTNVENLHLINSGPLAPNPNELLSINNLTDFFEKITDDYAYVLLDTPPLGIVSDPLELSKFVDVTLFIIRQNQTPRDSIDFLNDTISRGLLKNVGIIFNGVDFKKFNYKYGYRNSYKYSKYFAK